MNHLMAMGTEGCCSCHPSDHTADLPFRNRWRLVPGLIRGNAFC